MQKGVDIVIRNEAFRRDSYFVKIDWGLGSGRLTFRANPDGNLLPHNLPISYPICLDTFGKSYVGSGCALFIFGSHYTV